ncbi:50S ribosomal protein L6 [bacterium]|nr:MAG: 50S ribosomal protein L6 [bacterium]
MSRIGKKPIAVPSSVKVDLTGGVFTATGPKGTLKFDVHPDMGISIEPGVINITRPTDNRSHRALHGMTRSVLANMVTGVSAGFEKSLEIQGIGYRANMQGPTLVMSVGLSHNIEYQKPAGVDIEVKDQRVVTVKGIDKNYVGQIAATIRAFKPPEPYKGTGIRYANETVRRKEGKAGAK